MSPVRGDAVGVGIEKWKFLFDFRKTGDNR